MVNLIIGLEIFGITMLFAAQILLLRGEVSKEQKLMCYFTFGSLVQNVGYLLELTAPTMETAVAAIKVQYLGSLFVPLFYCWFIFEYCHKKTPIKVITFLGIADLTILALVYTCDWHNLYYRQFKWLMTNTGHGYVSISYGPFYWLFLACGCAIPFGMSLYALIHASIKNRSEAADRKYGIIIFFSALPLLSLLAYALKITQIVDFTPVVLGLVLSNVVILVWSRRNYDFTRLASRVVLRSISDGVIALDDQKRIVHYNPAAADIFPQLISHEIGDSIDTVKGFPTSALQDNHREDFSLNGRSYEIHSQKIYDHNKKHEGYAVLILDVTDTRNYIEEIKSVREQAEKANMAKSEFLANMSHETRTPMNAIMGLSDIIMDESKGQEIYAHACDIKSASLSLLTIINDILDLSKIEAGKMELIPEDYYIKGMVGDVIGIMDMAASQRGLLLKYKYDETMPCAYHGPAGRIKQILINLLNNSVKFTKEGYVKLTISGTPLDDGNELLQFIVEDTGCGIRKEDLEKIFEAFRQVDSKRNRTVEGTGLGLSITRHLVTLMGGTISVDSTYGKGTTFTVTIPQKIVDSRTLTEMPEPPVEMKEEWRPFTVDNYKVLVVDDNMINRKVALRFLKVYGFDLTEASGGREAIDLVKKNKYNIIFMDHMMPELDGIETVEIIRNECGENGRTPIIIALTANAMDGVREKFMNSGFEDFVAKPLDRKQLNSTLEQWIPESSRHPLPDADAPESPSAENDDFENVQIEGIDISEVKRQHSGDLSDFKDLLQLYCIDGKRKLVLIRELYEKKDYKTYEIEVHGLKSASANVGAMALSRHSKEHEDAASRGDTDFIAKNIEKLLSAYGKQLQAIQGYLDQSEAPPDSSGAAQSTVTDAEISEKLKSALGYLENFRSRECEQELETLLQYSIAEDIRTALKEIIEQLKIYEDDEAERLLHQLIKQRQKEGLS